MRSLFFWAIAALPAIDALSISKSSRCGQPFGLTCTGSTFGNCCSQNNFCGTTSGHCGTGCQSGYGTCSYSPPTPPTTKKVSNDGSCGGSKKYTCLNSAFGNCCSQYGYCGKTGAYCGTGCDSAWGTCSGVPTASLASSTSTHTLSTLKLSTLQSSTSTSSIRTSSIRTSSIRTSSIRTSSISTSTKTSTSADPSSTSKLSHNARCGVAYGASPGEQTCLGSNFGDCCSKYSYCGRTDDYCGKGCQAGFGKCNSALPSSPTSSSRSSSKASSSSRVATSTSSKPSSVFPSSSVSSSTTSKSSSVSLSSSVASSISTTTSSQSSSSSIASSISSSASSVSPSSSETSSTASISSESSTSSEISTTFTSTTSTESSTSSTSPDSSTSVISSQTPSMTSSSTQPPSTTIAPPTSSCVPYLPTNALVDGSFESGVIDNDPKGWFAIPNQWTVSPGIKDNGYDAQDGTHYYSAGTDFETQTGLSLIQTNIRILSGTTVRCTGYARSHHSTGSSTMFQMNIDGTQCGSSLVLGDEDNYYQFGGYVTLSGDVHDVRIEITSFGSNEPGTTMQVDNFEVIPVSGPGSIPIPCDTGSSSSSVEGTLSIPPISGSSSESASSSTSSSESASSSITSSQTTPSESSSTTSSSTSSVCTPTSTIDASFNPSFESGHQEPWSAGGFSGLDSYGALNAVNAPFAPSDGSSAFYITGYYRSSFTANYFVEIQSIPLTPGSTVSCSMAIKWIQSNSAVTVSLTADMRVDSSTLSDYVLRGVTIDWTRVGGTFTVGPDQLHTFRFNINVPAGLALPPNSVTIGFDDFQCIPASQCASAPPPGETL